MNNSSLAQAPKSDRGRYRGARAVASTALLLSFVTSAAAETSAAAQGLNLLNLEKHTELCNRVSDTSPDDRIASCSALIESGAQTPRALAIAYNNRGNAYFRKGDYETAIEDYDKSIKADPKYARAFNNRGLAFQKEARLRARDRRPYPGHQT